jgi:hypothetical protein
MSLPTRQNALLVFDESGGLVTMTEIPYGGWPGGLETARWSGLPTAINGFVNETGAGRGCQGGDTVAVEVESSSSPR